MLCNTTRQEMLCNTTKQEMLCLKVGISQIPTFPNKKHNS